jgi:hypothetical protein
VDTRDSVAIASGVRDIWKAGSGGNGWRAHLAGRGHRVKACVIWCDHNILSRACRLIY